MDNSRFDDIIKSKLESHVDPIGPSGSEVSQLFDGLSGISSTAVSTVTKVLIVTSSMLLAVSIFFIYRTYILEETITSLQKNLIEQSQNQSEISFQPDTLFWDSLQVITKRIFDNSQQNTIPSQQIEIASKPFNEPTNYVSYRLSPSDSQRFVNEVMIQLIATLESNPQFFKQAFANFPNGLDVVKGETDVQSSEPNSTIKFSRFTEKIDRNQKMELLKNIAAVPENSQALRNIMNGDDPGLRSDDRLDIAQSRDGFEQTLNIDELDDDSQNTLLDKFIKYDPLAASIAAKNINLDSTSIGLIETNPIAINKKINTDTTHSITPITTYRDQHKQNAQSWWIYGGPGFGRVVLNEAGKTMVNSYKLAAEYQPNSRFGISSGAELYSLNGESYKVASLDYDEFEDFGSKERDEIREIKIDLKWMDLPLEAKLYLMPDGKINPYVSVGIRARTFVKEYYTFETEDHDRLTPEFESETKFVIPVYNYTLGMKFQFSPKLKGAIQFQQTMSTSEMGIFKNDYNSLQGQALIFYRIQ